MLKRAPEGMRFNPSGLRRISRDQADVDPTLRAGPLLVNQPMRALPACLDAAEGCAKARIFSRGRLRARNSHFASSNFRVTREAAVWRPREPRVYRACQRQRAGVTTPLRLRRVP